jgi:hypothetical protein
MMTSPRNCRHTLTQAIPLAELYSGPDEVSGAYSDRFKTPISEIGSFSVPMGGMKK